MCVYMRIFLSDIGCFISVFVGVKLFDPLTLCLCPLIYLFTFWFVCG